MTAVLALAFSLALSPNSDPRLAAAKREDRAGWVYLHLQGKPADIGFQYGSLACTEIDDGNRALKLYLKHETGKDWAFYRNESKRLFWNKVPAEYQSELQGIAEGMKSKGYNFDWNDALAQNAWFDLAWYYIPLLNSREQKRPPQSQAPLNCSAFIATGSQTKDGGIVMAHNAWVDFVIGERWNLMLDIVPEKGYRILMDAWPGFIHSGDDFAINSAGMMITETTISNFIGFDEKGVPEFVRMRQAIQYGDSLSKMYDLMVKGNNGGYANMWLMGDTKTGEIGKLELGLKNVVFHRTFEGAYVSSNFPEDPKLSAEECEKDAKTYSNCCSDRRTRWKALMARDKGKVDAELAKAYLGDHHDEVLGKDGPSSSTLCGHWEVEPRAAHIAPWPAYAPGGSCEGKVTTSALAKKMSLWARMGHPCGTDFLAAPFLKQHPEFSWQLPSLRDMKAGPWALFSSGE